MSKKFLDTTIITSEAMNSILSGSKVVKERWSSNEDNISKRIKAFDDVPSSNISYSDIYFYLSSYVHADAGYLITINYTKGNMFPAKLYSISSMCAIETLKQLEVAGVVTDGSMKYLSKLKIAK